MKSLQFLQQTGWRVEAKRQSITFGSWNLEYVHVCLGRVRQSVLYVVR